MRQFATEADAQEYEHVVAVADWAAQHPGGGGHSWDALMAGAAVPALREAARKDLGRALKKSGWLARVEGAYLYRATPEGIAAAALRAAAGPAAAVGGAGGGGAGGMGAFAAHVAAVIASGDDRVHDRMLVGCEALTLDAASFDAYSLAHTDVAVLRAGGVVLQLALRLMAERAGILHELGAGFEAAEAAASTLVAALGAPGVRSGAALDALVQRVQAAADAQNDAHAAPTPPPVHAPLLPARLLEPHAALAPPSSAAALAAADASGGEEERGAGAGAGAGDGRTRKEDEQDKRKSTSDVPGVLLPKRDNLRVRPRVRACATSVASGDECVPGDEWGCHDSDSDSDGDSDYVGKDTPRKRVVRKRGKASAPQPNGQGDGGVSVSALHAPPLVAGEGHASAAAQRIGPGLASAVARAADDDGDDAAAMEEPEEKEVAGEGSAAAALLSIAPSAATEPAAALPTAAPTAAPVLAPPAAAAPASVPLAAEDDKLAAVATFLRGIRPPLEQLDAALAALPGSGVTVARLASFAASSECAMLVDRAAASLRLELPFDRLAVLSAVLALPHGTEQA